MGIQGLLPALKSVTTAVHVKEYAGKTVAVDTYSWLHKGAYTCCKELCEGKPTSKYVDYCMQKVNLLRHHGVKPLLVFDGGLLPMKAEQEAKRARSRKQHLDCAHEHEYSGNRSAAYECYQKAVDITPHIALGLIEELRKEGVDYIVAPYEADAQLAFLCHQGYVDTVITEDSDMVAYCCPKVLFKMDKHGQGDEFQFGNIGENRDLDFTSFTNQMVIEMCVLSGCDYLSSLQGMGVKKAHGLIRRFKCFQKVLKHLRFSGMTIAREYDEKFEKAVLTFQHQRVYDPVKEDIVHITEIPFGLDMNLDFLGPWLPQPLVKNIAEGVVDPITLKPFANSLTYPSAIKEKAEQRKPVNHESFKKRIKLPLQKNQLSSYFIPASRASKQQFRAPRGNTKSSESPGSMNQLPENDQDGPLLKTSIHTKISSAGTSDNLQQVINFEAYEQCQMGLMDTGAHSSADVLRESWKMKGIEVKSEERLQPFLHAEKRAVRALDVWEGAKFSPVPSGQLSPHLLKRSAAFEEQRSGKVVVRSGYFSSKSSKLNGSAEKLNPGKSNKELKVTNEQGAESLPDPSKLNDENLDPVNPDVLTGKFEQMGNRSKKDDGSIRSRVSDDIIHAKNKHVPAFSSCLLVDLNQKQSFSSNLSHLDQYVSIAQKSVDRFVSRISSFQCSTKGARVSGLRPPQRCSLSTREFVKSSIKEADFTKFSHDSRVSKN